MLEQSDIPLFLRKWLCLNVGLDFYFSFVLIFAIFLYFFNRHNVTYLIIVL